MRITIDSQVKTAQDLDEDKKVRLYTRIIITYPPPPRPLRMTFVTGIKIYIRYTRKELSALLYFESEQTLKEASSKEFESTVKS